METTTISCLEEYISTVKDYHSMEGSIGMRTLFYRGQSDVNYKLLPSLGRRIRKELGSEGIYELYEEEIIRRVKLEYPELFRDTNTIDEMALMQHYGVPTRLLDVTENPLVALFFACRNNPKKNGEVFLFAEGTLMDIFTSYEEKELKENNRIAIVRAKKVSSRQRIQQGCFLWFPKEKTRGIKKNDPLIVASIRIPAIAKESLLDELRVLGISERRLFPDDMEKCCKELIADITKDCFSA